MSVLVALRRQLDLCSGQMTDDQRAVQRALEHVHFDDHVAGMTAAELQLIDMNDRIQQMPVRGETGDLDAALREIGVQARFELRH